MTIMTEVIIHQQLSQIHHDDLDCDYDKIDADDGDDDGDDGVDEVDC